MAFITVEAPNATNCTDVPGSSGTTSTGVPDLVVAVAFYMVVLAVVPVSCGRVVYAAITLGYLISGLLGKDLAGFIPAYVFLYVLPAGLALVLLRDVVSLAPARMVVVRQGADAAQKRVRLIWLMLTPWPYRPTVWSFRCPSDEAQQAFITQTCTAFPDKTHIFCTDNLPKTFDLGRVLWFENLYRVFGVRIQPGEENSDRPWMVLERICGQESFLLWTKASRMLRSVQSDPQFPQNCPVMLLSMTNMFVGRVGGLALVNITRENAANAELIVRDVFWGFYRPSFLPPLLFPINLVLGLLWLHWMLLKHTLVQLNFAAPSRSLSCFYAERGGVPYARTIVLTVILLAFEALQVYGMMLDCPQSRAGYFLGMFLMYVTGLTVHGTFMWFGLVGLASSSPVYNDGNAGAQATQGGQIYAAPYASYQGHQGQGQPVVAYAYADYEASQPVAAYMQPQYA